MNSPLSLPITWQHIRKGSRYGPILGKGAQSLVGVGSGDYPGLLKWHVSPGQQIWIPCQSAQKMVPVSAVFLVRQATHALILSLTTQTLFEFFPM